MAVRSAKAEVRRQWAREPKRVLERAFGAWRGTPPPCTAVEHRLRAVRMHAQVSRAKARLRVALCRDKRQHIS
eukprot:1487075-Alexandrium_andersonii.AAC.1